MKLSGGEHSGLHFIRKLYRSTVHDLIALVGCDYRPVAITSFSGQNKQLWLLGSHIGEQLRSARLMTAKRFADKCFYLRYVDSTKFPL